MVTRRKFMAMGAAAGAVVVASGAAFAVTDRFHGWIGQILHRWLPGYSFDPEGLARFFNDYYRKQGNALNLRMFAAAEAVVDVKSVLPGEMETRIEEEERRILSAFLVGSDFFETYPNGPKKIIYRGARVACGSPFATF